jgi:hypothetical protein
MSAVDQTHYSIFTVGAGNLFIGLMIAIGCWMLNIRISRDRIDLHSSGHLLVQPKM